MTLEAITLEEFAQDFFQDIHAEAEANKDLLEDTFFQRFCEYLTESGELDSADRSPYLGPPGQGIRVDGYGGDPASEASDTLNLLILDFKATEEVSSLNRSDMNAIFKRLKNFLVRSLDDRWRNALEESSPGFGLADLIAGRWHRIQRVRFILITNRRLSERVEGREADAHDDRPISHIVWDIQKLYRQALIGYDRPDLEIDLTKDFGGPIAVLPAQQEDMQQSYLAILPGQVLAEIYDRWGTRLLEQNVRVFLQARGKVNKGIRKTLEEEPEMFFSYNNGITATAEEARICNGEGGLMLHWLKNFQIVNGGQTTASIHAAVRANEDISRTFVQMKLSIVSHELATELVPKISEFANTQNRVNAADFFANHPFHVRMEQFSRRIFAPSPDGTFQASKWFYERARGQHADARGGLTRAERRKFDIEYPRRQLFTKTDLAKFLSVWEQRPHEVSRGAQKNFAFFAQRIGKAWERSSNDFNEAWYREAVSRAIVFKATEKLVTEQPWYEGGYRANIVAYAIAKLAHDVEGRQRAVDFKDIWQRQALTPAMEEALTLAAESAHGVLLDAPFGNKNVTEWAKREACWDKVRELIIPWPEEFLETLISLEERAERLKDARREQRQLNDMEAQTVVVSAGPEFWQDVLNWIDQYETRFREYDGFEHFHLLIPPDMSTLKRLARGEVPSGRNAKKAHAVLQRLQRMGYSGKLPSDS